MLIKHATARGMTVIEILVAVFILSIGAYTIFDNLNIQASHGRDTTRRMQAQMLARQKVEELRAAPYAALKQWQAPAQPAVLPDNLRYQYLASVKPGDKGALNLSVTVGWNVEADGAFVPGNSVEARGVRLP